MGRQLPRLRQNTEALWRQVPLTSYFPYRRNRLEWGGTGPENTIEDRQALRSLRDTPACRNPKANPCATPPPDFSGSPANEPRSRLAAYRGRGCTKSAVNTLIGRSFLSGLARS